MSKIKTISLCGLIAISSVPALAELQHQDMDVNQDGLVSKAEWVHYVNRRFDELDANKDQMLKSGEVGRGALEYGDKNKDGGVSLSEYQQFRQGHFERKDQDQSGTLTLREVLESPAAKTAAATVDFSGKRAKLEALSSLTTAPAMHLAEGFDSTDNLVAIYYEALDWQGQPTKVFAWLGMPDDYEGEVPAMVLVHSGSAYKEWVQEWTARGYAAISISVEGQTDRRVDKVWERHEWAGPQRVGIYGDSTEALEDQWMYHAVADTILANSLIRTIDGVDASRVGVMGISWGGVITSTVIGLDDRFAFGVPTFGCGGLASAENRYGEALGNNETYKQVWDPMLRLRRAKLPTLWLSRPEGKHFPMDIFALNYATVTGEHMVSLVPKMGHGHGPGWNRPECYAFADSIVNGLGPWCVPVRASLQGDLCKATFRSTKVLDAAVLVSTTDRGVSGERKWVETPATVVRKGSNWSARATLPAGSTAWFMNVKSGDLVTSSDYQEVR